MTDALRETCKRLLELAAQKTPGKWVPDRKLRMLWGIYAMPQGNCIADDMMGHDAAFIAAACNAAEDLATALLAADADAVTVRVKRSDLEWLLCEVMLSDDYPDCVDCPVLEGCTYCACSGCGECQDRLRGHFLGGEKDGD